MYIPLLWILVCFLCIIIVFLIICCITLNKSKNIYLDSWRRWESEYWILRNSNATDTENYNIHLSWLPIGTDNCIVEKNNIKIEKRNDNKNEN